jgi:hypothetical protein
VAGDCIACESPIRPGAMGRPDGRPAGDPSATLRIVTKQSRRCVGYNFVSSNHADLAPPTPGGASSSVGCARLPPLGYSAIPSANIFQKMGGGPRNIWRYRPLSR